MPFRLFDFACTFQQTVQIAIFVDQQSCRFHTDARGTGNIIHAIACQCLNVDNTFWVNAKLCVYTIPINAVLFHGVKHFDAAPHQLHQILVGTDNGDASTCITCLTGKCCDNIIRLISLNLFASDVEGACCITR